MRAYIIGLGVTLGGITALATLPFWLPALVVVSLFTVVPFKIGKALTQSSHGEQDRVL